ncbi:MAG TPA: redox-sensitive transcriptional activator SoxR [Tepidiformaceae bacterium]|nr:redox-sensitive transcriptional activator SoxR [Tepidiformaceae bacterium]
MSDQLTIGDLARRSGVATSALRFYESCGLLSSHRTEGGQRRYDRATLRRVAVIRAGQAVGLTLEEIRAALASLPSGRTPDTQDWARLSSGWRRSLDRRIGELERLRDKLSGCIGCGCLSLTECGLLNPGDVVAAEGPGAHYLDVPTSQ